MKSNSTRIRKFGGLPEASMYSGISTGDGTLQYDQEPIAFMSERMKPFDVKDHRNPQIITNVPHTKDIEKRIFEKIQPWLLKPDTVYRRVCDSSRTMPYLERLEAVLSPIYSNKLIDNIVRLKIYSPIYYQKILEKQLSFEKYQEFFYLLILIQYVDFHKHEEAFQQIQEGIRNVIDWVRTRVIEDIDYFIQGPVRNANVTLDYEQTFKGLISPSNTTESVNEYLQLTTMQQINDLVALLRQESNDRKNVYDKNPNIAGSYLLSVDSELNSSLYVNSTKDLVVDCMSIDLGNSNSERVDLNIHNAELTDKMLHHDPKIASKKLENLMNVYTIFNIKNLLILKSTYKTSLDAFDKVYVVFPGITMDGRFNQVYTTGTLQVSGHFIESANEKYWEFVSDTDIGIVYNPTTVHVDSFEFYISNTPGSKTNLSYNNFKISTHMNQYFNCPLVVQKVGDLEPNVYIIRMNDITEGKLSVLPYTFIYNANIKTIQLLPTNYEYDSIPRYDAKKMRKVTPKYEANVYPTQPSTVNVIIDEIREAKVEAKKTKSDTLTISLDKPVQPATIEGISKRMAKGEKSWTFRGQTVDFSGKTVEQIVKEFNEREYDVSNVVDFSKEYIDNLKSTTVNFKGKKYSLIKPNGERMTGEEFFNMLGIETIVDCAERISAELMEEYNLELTRFDKDALSTQVNPGFSEPQPEDFASLSEYYLFRGLFKPDYDYIVETSAETKTVKANYVSEDAERINSSHEYSVADFFDKSPSEISVECIENPPAEEGETCIKETVEFVPDTSETSTTGTLTTTVVKYPAATTILETSKVVNYTAGEDDYHYTIDDEQFLKSGELIKYTIENKTLLTFDKTQGSRDFTDDLYICFKDEETSVYSKTTAVQKISSIVYTQDVLFNNISLYPLESILAYITDVDYNTITFGFYVPSSESSSTETLDVTINGTTTTYYKHLPGFYADQQINMFREVGNSSDYVYELISFDSGAIGFTTTPTSSATYTLTVVNKVSTLFKKALDLGKNTNIPDLTLDVQYGMCYNEKAVDSDTTEEEYHIIEKVKYSLDGVQISDYETINFIKSFVKDDLKTDFPSTSTFESTDWKTTAEEESKHDIEKITKDGQLLTEDVEISFEYYTASGIKDVKSTKSYSKDGVDYGDVMGVVKEYIDNEHNKIDQSEGEFGFKGKYITYPISYTDPEKIASEEELKSSICGDIYGYIDDDGEFKELYYSTYGSSNTLDFELISENKNVYAYSNQLSFPGLWRRVTLNTKTISAYTLDNIVSVEFVNRTIPLKDNIYKTFKVGVDVLNTKFGINDFLYSYGLFTSASTMIDRPYYELVDMEIKDVGYYDRLEFGNEGFDDPVKPKYFINYISHFKSGLIVNSEDYGFNTYSVKFKDSDYILETINKDLFGISYNTPIEDSDNFYSRGSRIKMIVELK